MTPQEDPPVACQAVADDLAEFALGVLPGRERATVLAHLDGCDRCRAEVEQLSMAADGVLRAAPQVQPPDGFEERVLAGMVSNRERRRVVLLRQRQRSLVLGLAAAAAIVVLAVLVGIGLTGSSGGPASPSTTSAYASAALTAGGQDYGRVSTYNGAGHPASWLSMTIHDRGGTGWVRCQVTVRGGPPMTVGTFWVDNGSGRWDAALPMPADDVTGAQVLGPNSVVLATANFRT